MNSSFFMPVYTCDLFFSRDTEQVFRDSLPLIDVLDAPKAKPRFLEVRFYMTDPEGEFCVAEKSVHLWPNPRSLDLTLASWGNRHLEKIARAWSEDALAEQCVLAHPFPWGRDEIGRRMAGRFLSLFWSPEFSILAQEHIPTFLEDDDFDPLGEGHTRESRTALASMILPPAQSEHARLARHAALLGKMDALDQLWRQMTIGHHRDIALQLENPESPIAIG